LRIREFKAEKTKGDLIYFRDGTYDKSTGLAKYKTKELPSVLDKMTKLHKANTDKPLFYFKYFLWCVVAVFRCICFLDVYSIDGGFSEGNVFCTWRAGAYFDFDLRLVRSQAAVSYTYDHYERSELLSSPLNSASSRLVLTSFRISFSSLAELPRRLRSSSTVSIAVGFMPH